MTERIEAVREITRQRAARHWSRMAKLVGKAQGD